MPDNKKYMEMSFFIEKMDDGDFGEQDLDNFLDDFLEFIEDKGMVGGGCLGYMKDDDEYDEDEPIEEKDRCESCGGSGRKQESEEDKQSKIDAWNELYAPVAQLEEHSPPKGKVEGSSPSGSATFDEAEDMVDRMFTEAERRAGRRSLGKRRKASS